MFSAKKVTTSMGTDVQVRVLRTISEIDEIRSTWGAWPGNRDSDPDAYLSYMRSSPQGVQPYIIVVYRGGQPVVMLVGRAETVHLDFKVGYLHFRPKANLLYFVYGGPRGNASSQNCELLVAEICKSLSSGEGDAAYLNFVRTDSDLCRLARTTTSVFSRDRVSAIQPHFRAVLPNSVEEFHRGLSPKVRKNLRWKKMMQDFAGAVTIKIFKDIGEVDRLAEVAEGISAKSYQRGLGVGFRDGPGTRERLRLGAQKGWLRGYVLYLADRPCAFWIGDINRTTFGSDYLAYDPTFGKYSPGMYLSMRIIEGFCAKRGDDVSEVDFGPGHAEYKEALGNHKWQEASVYIFAPSVKGLGLNILRSSTAIVETIAKRALNQAGLLQRIKKSWRTRARIKAQTKNAPITGRLRNG